MEAGCIIKDFVSPTFAKCENNVQFSTTFFAPSKSLLTENVKTEPKPNSKYFFANSYYLEIHSKKQNLLFRD